MFVTRPAGIGELFVIQHEVDRPFPSGAAGSVVLRERGLTLVRGTRDLQPWELEDVIGPIPDTGRAIGRLAARVAAVVGKADTDHIVPDNPWDPRNRRISITLLREPKPRSGGGGGARATEVGQDPPGPWNGTSLYSIAPRF